MMGEQPTNDRPTGDGTTSNRPTDESPTGESGTGNSATESSATDDTVTDGSTTGDWATAEFSTDATLLSEVAELEYDDAEECYRVRLDGSELSLSVAVVEAVAAVTETDPLALRPLRESIDPDALDDLFSGTRGGLTRGSGRVEFPFNDCHVVVDATGEIAIRPTDEQFTPS